MTPPAPRVTASGSSRPIARSATPCRCGSASVFRGPARRAGECEMNDNGGEAFPLPLAGEGAEPSEAGGGSLRESHRGESPHPNPPPPTRGRGRTQRRVCFVSSLRHQGMIRESGWRFSVKIILHQKNKVE